ITVPLLAPCDGDPAFTQPIRVPAGTYTVAASGLRQGERLPGGGVVVSQPGELLTLDFSTREYPVAVTLRWNGQPAPVMPGLSTSARLYLWEVDGDRLRHQALPSGAGPGSVSVPEGIWIIGLELEDNLAARHGWAGNLKHFRFPQVLHVPQDKELTVDLETRWVEGELLVDGVPPRCAGACRGTDGYINFRSREGEPYSWAHYPIDCSSGRCRFAGLVQTGVREVNVERSFEGAELPLMNGAVLDAIDIR
ncbi:MAG: hypothetical protein ACYC8T_23055, partial [Myxococcaceae bacterium]